MIAALTLAVAAPSGALAFATADTNGILHVDPAKIRMDETLSRARHLPVDPRSVAGYSDPAHVVASQLAGMGVSTTAATLPHESLAQALATLALARGQDASVLASWQAPALPQDVSSAMADTLVAAAKTETDMRVFVAHMDPKDVAAVESYLAAVTDAAQRKDAASVLSPGDLLASRLLAAPAPSALSQGMQVLGPDALAFVQANENLDHILLAVAPPSLPTFVDPTGNLEVASGGTHTDTRTLLVDTGGDSTYEGSQACGSAIGLGGTIVDTPLPTGPVMRAASAVIDLGGSDQWEGVLCNAGAGILGVGVSLNHGSGKHSFLTGAIGQGAALGGVGLLVENDTDTTGGAGAGECPDFTLSGTSYHLSSCYIAVLVGQGAALVGVGALLDPAGSNLYAVGAGGQGFGVLGGNGLLVDGTGDSAFVGFTLAQGFGAKDIPLVGSIGTPSAQGTGTLVHPAGNDLFLLANPAGEVIPAMGQGAGVDAGIGTLAGGAGNDHYFIITLGALGHDAAATSDGQGYGANGGVGTFADLRGSDESVILAAALTGVIGGGEVGNSVSSSGGQGLGTNDGHGVYIDGSADDLQLNFPAPPTPGVPDVPPVAPDPTTLASTSSEKDSRYLASLSLTAALSLGNGLLTKAGDAKSSSAGQGAGLDGGTGALLSGKGEAANSLTADAVSAAGAADFQAAFSAQLGAELGFCTSAVVSVTFGAFGQAFAMCTATAVSSASAAADTHSETKATAGDAITSTFGQGYGAQNGVGVLLDAGGRDIYEEQANSLPVALAIASALSVALTADIAAAVSGAFAGSINVDLAAAFGQFANAIAPSQAYARAVTFSFADASATSTATSVANAMASVGSAISHAEGQGAGTLGGVGALVDHQGPDAFLLMSLAKPIAFSGALAASGAAALAAAVAASLSVATALASAFAVAFAVGAAGAFSFGAGGSGAFGWGFAFALAIGTAVAAAIAAAFAGAEALAVSGADTQAIAQALAKAIARASAAAATSASVGSTDATSEGQGWSTLDGTGLLLRLGEREHVGAPDAGPTTDYVKGLAPVPPTPPLPVTPPGLPPEAQAIVDQATAAAGTAAGKANGVTDAPTGDSLVIESEGTPNVISVSGSLGIAFAFVLATALAAGISAAASLSAALATGVAAAAALAIAVAGAAAVCIGVGWGFAWCVAIATAIAVAIAVAAALAVAVAAALAGSLATAVSFAMAQAQSEQSAAAASSSSASVGTVSATSAGQADASLGSFAATTGGNDADSYTIESHASLSGLVAAISFAVTGSAFGGNGDFGRGSNGNGGACASSSSLSAGNILATSTGQAHAATSAVAALADAGGNDAYALRSDATNDVQVLSYASCSAAAGAVATSLGTVAGTTAGQASASDRGVAAFVDLGGHDTYTENGRGDDQASTSGNLVGGSAVPTSVFVDTEMGTDIVDGAYSTAQGTACSAAPACPLPANAPPVPA